MREIKFRAWDKKLKRMIGKTVMDSFTIRNDGAYSTSNDIYIMQYTGLLDKNGKEIYEGDVVRAIYYSGLSVKTFSYGVVEYIDTDVTFLSKVFKEIVMRSNETISKKCKGYDRLNHHTIEVIGNIYSNPELLEQ